ncbi:MAG: hypothetical protein LBN97_10170 [Oscillospiraceae bacterium]|jgi:vacuolar-type H+-ATPase subunit E/Vma4|nr:hypothetical protein [Oscillospiraceae bacterium]
MANLTNGSGADGVGKITAKILEEAREEAAYLIQANKRDVKELLEKYEKQAKSERNLILEAGDLEAVRLTERLSGAAETEAKKAVLTLKQEITGEVFALAAEKLSALPKEKLGNCFVELVLPDGSVQRKLDIDMLIERFRNPLIPEVSAILFTPEGKK